MVAILSVSVLFMWLFVEMQGGRFGLPAPQQYEDEPVVATKEVRLSSRDVGTMQDTQQPTTPATPTVPLSDPVGAAAVAQTSPTVAAAPLQTASTVTPAAPLDDSSHQEAMHAVTSLLNHIAGLHNDVDTISAAAGEDRKAGELSDAQAVLASPPQPEPEAAANANAEHSWGEHPLSEASTPEAIRRERDRAHQQALAAALNGDSDRLMEAPRLLMRPAEEEEDEDKELDQIGEHTLREMKRDAVRRMQDSQGRRVVPEEVETPSRYRTQPMPFLLHGADQHPTFPASPLMTLLDGAHAHLADNAPSHRLLPFHGDQEDSPSPFFHSLHKDGYGLPPHRGAGLPALLHRVLRGAGGGGDHPLQLLGEHPLGGDHVLTHLLHA